MSESRNRLLHVDDLLLAECTVRQQRRSGPGGQHRNKVATGIFLTHPPTGITVGATERRSLLANRQAALQRLRMKLAIERREEVSEVSELWKSRCQHGRISVSHRHHDYAIAIAEALDHLATTNWQPSVAAASLGCTPSALTRLIRRDAHAWASVNRHRTAARLPRLR